MADQQPAAVDPMIQMMQEMLERVMQPMRTALSTQAEQLASLAEQHQALREVTGAVVLAGQGAAEAQQQTRAALTAQAEQLRALAEQQAALRVAAEGAVMQVGQVAMEAQQQAQVANQGVAQAAQVVAGVQQQVQGVQVGVQAAAAQAEAAAQVAAATAAAQAAQLPQGVHAGVQAEAAAQAAVPAALQWARSPAHEVPQAKPAPKYLSDLIPTEMRKRIAFSGQSAEDPHEVITALENLFKMQELLGAPVPIIMQYFALRYCLSDLAETAVEEWEKEASWMHSYEGLKQRLLRTFQTFAGKQVTLRTLQEYKMAPRMDPLEYFTGYKKLWRRMAAVGNTMAEGMHVGILSAGLLTSPFDLRDVARRYKDAVPDEARTVAGLQAYVLQASATEEYVHWLKAPGAQPMDLNAASVQATAGSNSDITDLRAQVRGLQSTLSRMQARESSGRGEGQTSGGGGGQYSGKGGGSAHNRSPRKDYRSEHSQERGRSTERSQGRYFSTDGRNQSKGRSASGNRDKPQVPRSDPRDDPKWPQRVKRSAKEIDTAAREGRCYLCMERTHQDGGWKKCKLMEQKSASRERNWQGGQRRTSD